ncbi:hypothetical protein Zmor_006496 [Zophobas morio]|uniref:Uncharacterized protein n=1 Tax=Zophobas morio TaxID=2755281 RepID=A0AA38MNJ2_9CUCU|nr:hypothetical protein Zmor_006496 [Zophobas morio]
MPMKPKLPKLNKSNGKNELILSRAKKDDTGSSTESADRSHNDNVEIQEQFELELCWCIQQLQRSLNSGKLNQKQVQEHTKVLNSLMSNSTPFIKKRQLMRLTFGDYRTKMTEESRKLSKGINMKISSSSPCKKSKFVKKSLLLSNSDNDFKFNFPVENTESDLSNEMSKVKINSKPFHFITSSNDFRFNFSAGEN